MQISDKNPLAVPNAGVQPLDILPQPQRAQKAGSQESPSPSSDRIELSVRSREIMHIDELIRSTPDIREAKVEQIRSAIQTGTYNVKAENIADKILGGHLLDEVF